MADIKRSETRVRGFHNGEMDFQLMRQLGSAAYGGASPGECLAAAGRIRDGEPASWVEAFSRMAEWQRDDAAQRAAKGHGLSARGQFLKACNSFRAAEYYTSCLDPRHGELGRQAHACFLAAMQYSEHSFEEFQLPYKGITLPIYFLTPRRELSASKTLLVVSGFDGTREEEYLMRGVAALERGYNVVLYAGPGQMDLFRFHENSCFEPDFEHVTSAVIDALADRPEIDPHRIALMGISFGGYFATRSAAHDARIKALVANSPILDLSRYVGAFLDHDPAGLPDEENFTIADLPEIPDEVFPPEDKARSENLMVRFGDRSFRDTFRYLKEFTVGDSVADIRCPSLALVGSGEGAEPDRQFEEFAAKVSGPVTRYRFSEWEGADTHCQVGNPVFAAAVALDWLDEVFA